MADGVTSTATAEVSSAGQERQRLQRKDDKKSRSIFDVAPDFFDSCRLLQSPLSVVSETTPISAIETLDDELAGEEAENTASMGSISRWSCNTCKAEFESLKDQRSHFKSDIHRFNVKLSIAGMNTVKEEDFDESTSDSFFKDNDISSISGSEDEVEKGSSPFNDVHSVLRGSVKQKLFIRLQGGERVSLWKSLILNEAENIIFDSEIMSSTDNGGLAPSLRENEVIEKLKFLIHEPRDTTHLRVVLLARGGHFAGCVLDGNSVVAHKTFHRYVIRAKAGKKQSSKDASGKAAHSAGASLRRHNELALKKEIQELLAVWKPYFDASLCVFIYAPSNNRQLFFRGEKPNFSCKHGVVRNVPLTVRRPTLKEAKRVYNLLTQVSYEVDEIYSSTIKDDSPQSVSIAGDNFPESSKEVLVDDVENKAAFKARLDVKRSDISISSGSEIEEVCLSTPLHEASKSVNAQKVLELLEQGLDPCVKDERGRTPYMVANDKEVRNTFRRFMAINLDKWDWHAANVPSALTKEMEEAQAAKQAEKDVKKKARAKEFKKLRKAREKKAQAEAALSQIATTVSEHLGTTSGAVSRGQTQSSGVAKISKEEELKMAQAAEREKRAAAAERRIAALNPEGGGGTNTNTTTSTSQPKGMVTTDIKCSCCETSLVGKVPFHRYNYKYCSTSCMHVHREMLEDG